MLACLRFVFMNPTLLIVDDEKHTREGLRAGLEDAFDVYIAADLAGATSVMEREHVDVLLTEKDTARLGLLLSEGVMS